MGDPSEDLVVGVLSLIAVKMEDLESTYFPDLGGEVISITDMKDLLKAVRDDIFAEIDAANKTKKHKPAQEKEITDGIPAAI